MLNLPIRNGRPHSPTPTDAELAFDCRHFVGDRPCKPHKRTGGEKVCVCDEYDPTRERVLVIKLDAMGDVLRTTALLPPLAAAHPHAAIDWLTRPESVPLLENNPYVADVIGYGPDALVRLGATYYDRVINLDAGKVSAGLASLARGAKKDGYVLHERGYVVATNPAAREWLAMGTNDDFKRANTTRTYQEIMLGILGLQGSVHEYVLKLRDSEEKWAAAHFDRLGLSAGRPVVGLNIGAGGRWELKKWRLDGFAELCDRLHARGCQLVLLGGKAEAERNAELIAASSAPIVDAGTAHDLRRFSALVGRCDVLVTGDTLAMHVALALKRRCVVLFGPTSAPEIDLYGFGDKVVPTMDCLGCYKMSCDFVPNCMDLISTDMVEAAVVRQLNALDAKSLSVEV
jgi:heptosyltransferase-2